MQRAILGTGLETVLRKGNTLRGQLVANRLDRSIGKRNVVLEALLLLLAALVVLVGQEAPEHVAFLEIAQAIGAVALLDVAREVGAHEASSAATARTLGEQGAATGGTCGAEEGLNVLGGRVERCGDVAGEAGIVHGKGVDYAGILGKDVLGADVAGSTDRVFAGGSRATLCIVDAAGLGGVGVDAFYRVLCFGDKGG